MSLEDFTLPAVIGGVSLVADQFLSGFTYPTLASRNGGVVAPILNSALMGAIAGLSTMYLMSGVDTTTVLSAAGGAAAFQGIVRPLYRNAIVTPSGSDFLIGSEGSLMTGLGAASGVLAYTMLMQ